MSTRKRKPRSDGQSTRAAILRAAQGLFVELGYERTTVRAIATRAACNPALVSRYFGGKRALFDSVVRTGTLGDAAAYSLLDQPAGSWGHALVHIQARTAGGADRDKLRDELLMLLRSVTTATGADELAAFLLREHAELVPVPAGPDAELRALLVQAQLVGLTVLRDMARLPQLRDADTATIARYLAPCIRYLLQDNGKR
ncbi:TetR family transcriptional regulator [Allokutzneria sp. A3M-2-11 16]|uniref:TetR/AcrR family transcriptional regulator n=1 Tax=Allokutzneria sp. A3M-2-11 16 TaxID=2962043 RepID=UPI0020B7BFCD|nr:TetR/AcrR family transcriptional regulator [Allokutzneria sp. A3M-2-11 16]MCP3805018.1 TetR family transcriptional regulator [Allokutzneria sp. A3M-2-11 16]